MANPIPNPVDQLVSVEEQKLCALWSIERSLAAAVGELHRIAKGIEKSKVRLPYRVIISIGPVVAE